MPNVLWNSTLERLGQACMFLSANRGALFDPTEIIIKIHANPISRVSLPTLIARNPALPNRPCGRSASRMEMGDWKVIESGKQPFAIARQTVSRWLSPGYAKGSDGRTVR